MKNIKTDGEIAIRAILEHLKLKFEEQKKIYGLKCDPDYEFRIADFYLPDYDVYIEFDGEYNHPRERQRYEKKKRVYKLNGIKCIHIIPRQLHYISKIIEEGLIELGIRLDQKKIMKTLPQKQISYVKEYEINSGGEGKKKFGVFKGVVFSIESLFGERYFMEEVYSEDEWEKDEKWFEEHLKKDAISRDTYEELKNL